MFVKPAIEGQKIPNPFTGKLLKAEGEEVPADSTYWIRRVRGGDVVEFTPPPAPVEVITFPADPAE